MRSFDDLKSIRKFLGKNQPDFAALLGVSLRAVQSYEQQRRNTPNHVCRQALFIAYLHRHRSSTSNVKPCWSVRRCDLRRRKRCPAAQLGAGRLCWMVGGNLCCDNGDARAVDTQLDCFSCPVIAQWASDGSAS